MKVGLVVGCPLEKFKELPATAVFQTGQLPKSLCQRDDSAVGHEAKRQHVKNSLGLGCFFFDVYF